MSRTVYLHVGIAKTGTTYLQRRLYANRDLLKRLGTLYPGAGPAAHFFGSLDLRNATFQGYDYPGSAGAWDRLVAAADAFGGTTLISHETLARAKPEEIERAVSSFTTSDVRVVITARDLARQLPAVWQETLKNRGETPYADYVEKVFASWSVDRGRGRGAFWAAQDLGALIERWSAEVGAERVTVVTVPPSGADREELWRRFARATNLPPAAYTSPDTDGNTSLGVAEAEVLRRLNPLLADTLDWPTYDGRVKKRLAETVLAGLETHGRLSLPPERLGAARQIARQQNAAIRSAGVTVVGDLADLEPEAADAQALQPDDLADGDLLASSLRVIAALVEAPAGPRESPARRLSVGRARRKARAWLDLGRSRLRRTTLR